MEKYICNLEHSMKLEKLGVKQESEFYWDDHYEELVLYNSARFEQEKRWHPDNIYSAFLVGELGEMLPDSITIKGTVYWLWCGKMGNRWEVVYVTCNDETLKSVESDTEVNARASMVEYLIENKLIKI